MTAFNIVRARPKADRVQDFLEHNRTRDIGDHVGLIEMNLVDTGNGEFIYVGQWESMEALAAARPAMIRTLDGMRDMLEDLGHDLGVTDPRSGEAAVTRRP